MSEVKVNKISPRSGTTVTLGDSGDTFTIPSGATINNQGTATNFGATGSASWVTTVKTSTFTAVAGEGYFVNTTGGVVSVNLPAGTAGAVVAIKDYAGTFDTNKVTLVQNGSDKIGGSTINATLETEGIAVTLVFIDSTQGWLVTDDGLQSSASQAEYVTASGGNTVATCGNFKIHTFTGPGTFTVSAAGNPQGSNTVDYLVVAGGGGGGFPGNLGYETGGGGAGGYRESSGAVSGCYSRSPLGACVSALPVSVQGYPITVGAGATAGGSGTTCVTKYPGNPSVFSTITSTAGGGGGSGGNPGAGVNGDPGGSGGGGNYAPGGSTGGTGNTPPVSPPQGNPGGVGNSPPTRGGGGGGATEAGTPYNSPPTNKAAGGQGATSSITGSPVGRAGGGNGGVGNSSSASPFGGGNCVGAVNTGSGGAGVTGGPPTQGKNGGSGIVVIRYKFQN